MWPGPGKDAKFGSWERHCKFHGKSFWKPVCTQKKTILEGTPDCKEATLNILKWWLLQSQYCKSARGYSACNPRAEEFIPDRSVLEQQLKDEFITDDLLSNNETNFVVHSLVSKPRRAKPASKPKPAAKHVQNNSPRERNRLGQNKVQMPSGPRLLVVTATVQMIQAAVHGRNLKSPVKL